MLIHAAECRKEILRSKPTLGISNIAVQTLNTGIRQAWELV